MIKLNGRQREVLDFLGTFQSENEYPAVVTDIQKRFGMPYTSALSVARRLESLGFVDVLTEQRKKYTRIRGIFVLHKE